MSARNSSLVINGDCLEVISSAIEHKSVALAYIDPPFMTQRIHSQVARNRERTYSFRDIWIDEADYVAYLRERIVAVRQVLVDNGVIVFHCDSTANHHIRLLLDEIFGAKSFRSEIIWSYRRWSNSARALIPSHQSIYVYSFSKNHTFNVEYTSYSPTTNVDQILQLRKRDDHGVVEYLRDESGEVSISYDKKGVPLGDVWEIPYLNPKAKERVGYPTQKPVQLLQRIIKIYTNEGDLVLDPFCGSGTTLVAALTLGRRAIGIDISDEAVGLARARLKEPIVSVSQVALSGRSLFLEADDRIFRHIQSFEYHRIERNKGIDALIEVGLSSRLPVRIQRDNEVLSEAIDAIIKATVNKPSKWLVVVRTNEDLAIFDKDVPNNVLILDSPIFTLQQRMFNAGRDDSIGRAA